MLKKHFLKLSAAALAATLSMTPAWSQENIELTVVSGYGPQASWVRVFREFWMPEVAARVAAGGNYTIEFTEAFGTVVSPRGELDATRTGIADIGLVVSAFHADRMPLPSISFVTPFVTSDLTLNAQTYDQLTSEFPAMRENWERFDMEFLGHMGVIRSYAILSDVPIQSVEDFDGLKFSGAGLNLRWIEGIGATGVPSALTSFYSDVESGVTDGMIAWADAITPFRLCEAASYLLRADMGAVTSFAVAANADAWADLPEEVQTVMREVTPLYRDELSRVTTEGDARGVDACIEQGGEVFDLPADERERWASALPPIALEWAADADAQGLPGTEVLSRYMEIMREADQPIARDWDQE